MSSSPDAAAGRKGQGGANDDDDDDDGRSPAPEIGPNWSLLAISRKGGKTAGHKDKYWFSPGGKRFRSVAEIGRFKDALETLEGGDNGGDEDAAWKIMKNSAPSSASKSNKKTASAKKKKGTTGTPTPKKKAARKTTPLTSPATSSAASTPSSTSSAAAAASSSAGTDKSNDKKKKNSTKRAATAATSATKKQKQTTIKWSQMDDDEEKKEDDDDMGAVKKSKSSTSARSKAGAKTVVKARKVTAKKKTKAATTATASSKKRAAARAKYANSDDGGVSDEEMDDFDESFDSDFEEKKPGAVAAKARTKRKKDVVVTSSDEEAAASGSSEDDKEVALKTPVADKKKKARKSTTRRPAKKKSKADDDDDDDDEEEDTTPTPPPTTTSRSGRVRKTIVRDNMVADFHSDISSSEDEDDDFERKPAARKGRGAAAKRGKKRAPPSDDESSEEESEVSSVATESSVEFSDVDEDKSEDELDFEEEEEYEEAPKKKNKGRGGKSGGAKKAKVKKAAGNGKKEKKSMAESFKPINSPPYFNQSLEQIYRDHECLDPCGTEATDDVIDRLVGDQVDKIGALLCRSLKSSDCDLGSAKSPLKLGTACSGTDAPALALTLVEEQMALRNLLPDNGGTDKDGAGDEQKLLNVEHLFSCEVDPFKQAYLARNFDSDLYPDIAKLCDDPPLDVYGRPKEIPPFNYFVAGTSCKNFSMLRASKRIDIEEKGCSGETFLAAVEVLFERKPKYCVFENVQGAPWEKMKEYITGRITLSNCSSSKAIKDTTAAEKKMDLTFALVDSDIVVDHVPGIYGVRCGSVVNGFINGDSSQVNRVTFPTLAKCRKERKCTLAQLMEHNRISKKTDTLVFETGVTYCAHYMKVDTKQFGLPQTRLRTYMFVWQPDDDNINDDLGEYWEAIVRHLEAPVRHSLESFILQADHEIIRVFREALNGPAGRISKRAKFMEPDFWKSKSANLKYSLITRRKSGIDEKARSLTSWGEYGQKQCPPHYWQEYIDICEQRHMDVLEIMHASAARDAESHDSSFASFFWNISQNAGKEKHRGAKTGIAGCLTPGGNIFLPHQGRPLLGCEKLLVQGIPYFRLLLGNETEVQLGDLAGNAMSLTVVCATTLAALTCKQLRSECLDAGGVSPKAMLEKNAALPTIGLEERLQADFRLGLTRLSNSNDSTLPCISDVFKKLLPLAKQAVDSSILCTCESSGRKSLSAGFVQCRQCGVSCCRDCLNSTAGYQLESHDVKSITVTSRMHGTFQSKLHEIVPTSVVFGEDGISAISPEHRAKDLDKFVFSLHQIRRDKKAWRIVYYARADAGTGEPIAGFVVTIGEVKERGADNTSIELGVQGELTSFLPAKLPPLVYGPMAPCAKVVVSDDGKLEWMQKTKARTTDLLVSGEGETPSFRAEAGINDDAPNALEMFTKTNHKLKLVAAAKKRGEQRRWLYPDNWMTWPETITIADGDASSSGVHGKYIRADCRQTTNQSALWIREKGLEPTLYLLLQPKVSRSGADYAVISSSISHQDPSSILATFPSNWQPCDALKSPLHTVKGVKLSSWSPLALQCRVPKSEITVSSSDESEDTLLEVSGFSDLEVTMLSRNDTSPNSSDTLRLNVARGQKAQQTVRVFNSLCITPILQHAAKGQLQYDLSPDASWVDFVPSPNDPAVGCCDIIVPRKPAETWRYDDERDQFVRQTEPGASRTYYTALQTAPQTFDMMLNTKEKKLVIKCDPRIAAHRAARNLIEGRGLFNVSNDVSVKYRLSDAARQTDPVLDPFTVSNCDALEPTSIELNEQHELYARQKKVVTKMAQIEDGMTPFEELEMFDETMPGSIGWSLIAKATRTSEIRGGVIADAIGAGKTVISIALIVRGIEHARAARMGPSKSSATLVVVPPGLLDQWVREIDKFAPSLRTVRIYGLQCLKKLRAKDLIAADVVLCPIDILEDKGYFGHVLQKCGSRAVAPKLPTYSGQQEKSEALGVWVPETSVDPYGGSKGSQQNRNESAHYTFVYTDAIQKLRKKSFKMSDKGVPLEYFEWERVIVDEIHESLCTTKGEISQAREAAKEDAAAGFFKEKNRRAGRELLGITEKDITKRPLRFRTAIFGLTGTPLLDNCDRVIELANLMGGTYVIGLSSHWRKLERESLRDIFLQHYLEPRQSREVRRNIYSYCQKYLDTACCRNKTGEEMAGIALTTRRTVASMNAEEKKLYLSSMSGIPPTERSLSIKPEDFDFTAGHDISRFLRQNAKLACRGRALVDICKYILAQEGNERTKIIVFADGQIGAGAAARDFLCAEEGLGCTWLDTADSVQEKNRKISWYQSADATEEDRGRPRVLLLNFEHAAGLNLQRECNNLILFTPLYVGQGGLSGDAVADASTELQAIGRVYRPGQRKQVVNVFRIEVVGPDDEECLDGQLIRRNTDEETIAMATNAAD